MIMSTESVYTFVQSTTSQHQIRVASPVQIFIYSACPSGTWGDSSSWTCITTCPIDTYYANVTVPLCVTKCPSDYYAYPIDRQCYAGGSCPTSPVRYFADDTTTECVSSCPSGYFADNSTGRCLRYCSSGTYAQHSDGTCVSTC